MTQHAETDITVSEPSLIPTVGGGRLSDPDVRAGILDEMKGGMVLIQTAMTEVLVEGSDYGRIPGTQTPSLLQPGAEKIRALFSFNAPTSIIHRHEDWAERVFAYDAECIVSDTSGKELTRVTATCSTEEDQYRRQHSERQSRSGRTLAAVNPAEQRETIMLMAQKRAFVYAVRRTAAASGLFSQDGDLVSVNGEDRRPTGGGGNMGAADPAVGMCPVHNTRFFPPSERAKQFNHGPSHKIDDTDGGGFCDYAEVQIAEGDNALNVMRAKFGDGEGSQEAATSWMRNAVPQAAGKGWTTLRPEDYRAIADAMASQTLADLSARNAQ